MNEHLKTMLDTLRINGNLRMRLEKIFNKEEPVISIDFLGTEHGKKLDVSKEDLPALLQICEAIPTLKTLIIIGQTLDDESMSMFAHTIDKLLRLNVLHIESSKISNIGIHHIAMCIQKHPVLETIYLHGDQLNDTAVDEIVGALLINTHTHRLSVSGMKINEAGIKFLAQLVSIDRLDQIAITCDYLSINSCQLLGHLIAKNNKLRGLAIEANKIDGLEFLMDGIKINSFLTDISISNNSLDRDKSSKIEQEITQITKRNVQGQYAILMDEALARLHQILQLSTDILDFPMLTKIEERVKEHREEARMKSMDHRREGEEDVSSTGRFSLFPTGSVKQ